MNYTFPDYYKDFSCIAGDCPATCCAGWQIVIDDRTLEKYRKMETPFGNRLANSIDWEEKIFFQYDGRCAFLNEENLCDIYSEAGEKSLCKTCKMYPRHYEEFENEREYSLAMSCPVVARMLLEREEPVRFLTKVREDEVETEEDFDIFLYSALVDTRKVFFETMQNRKLPILYRMSKVLTLAHDVQNRIRSGQVFDIQNVLERYTRDGADEALKRKIDKHLEKLRKNASEKAWQKSHMSSKTAPVNSEPESSKEIEASRTQEAIRDNSGPTSQSLSLFNEPLGDGGNGSLLSLFYFPEQLEVLTPSWPQRLSDWKRALQSAADSEVSSNWTGVLDDIQIEQIMVYFLYTYYCGAVYDEKAFSKVKMAVISTLLLDQFLCAEQYRLERMLTHEEKSEIVWSYCRELEHSDPNLNLMEEMLEKDERASLDHLLLCIAE